MTKKQTHYRDLVKLMVVGLILLIIGVLFTLFRGSFTDFEQIRELASAHPFFAPFIIIAIIVLEVVIAPLPGGFLSVLSGILFGSVVGGLYAWVGNVLGSSLAFWLARRFGKPVVERFVGSKHHERYDSLLHKNWHSLFLLYAVPVFPIDVISFLAGLTNMAFQRFVITAALGFLVHVFLLTTFGNYLFTAPKSVWFAVGVLTLGVIVLGHVLRKKVKC